MNDTVSALVVDCQEWISKSEGKCWNGPASTLVKFIKHSKRVYQWVNQEDTQEAIKVLTELLDHGKMPLETSRNFSDNEESLHCKACGKYLNSKDNLCYDCLSSSKDTLRDMLLLEGYTYGQLDDLELSINGVELGE